MLNFLFGNRKHDPIPAEIYGMVVAQAREPVFFTDFAIPDTVMGRFDVLALHTYLISRRLAGEGTEAARTLNQEVFDLFVHDLDRALRELGVGDTSVPKRKKKMVRSFYGQIDDFDGVLDEGDLKALEPLVAHRYYSGEGDAGNLARYMIAADQKLQDTPYAEIASGRIEWPGPVVA